MSALLLPTPHEHHALSTWRLDSRLAQHHLPQPAPRLELAFLQERHPGQAALPLLWRWSFIAPQECVMQRDSPYNAVVMGVEVCPLSWNAPWHLTRVARCAQVAAPRLPSAASLLAQMERHVSDLEYSFVRQRLTRIPVEPRRAQVTSGI